MMGSVSAQSEADDEMQVPGAVSQSLAGEQQDQKSPHRKSREERPEAETEAEINSLMDAKLDEDPHAVAHRRGKTTFVRVQSSMTPMHITDPLFCFAEAPEDQTDSGHASSRSEEDPGKMDDDSYHDSSALSKFRRVVTKKLMPAIFLSRDTATDSVETRIAHVQNVGSEEQQYNAAPSHSNQASASRSGASPGPGLEGHMESPRSRRRLRTRANIIGKVALMSKTFGASIGDVLSRTESDAARTPFVPSKALQRAAHRMTVTRAFQTSAMNKAKRDSDAHLFLKGQENPRDSLNMLKIFLSSERDNRYLIDITFDKGLLRREMHLIATRERNEQRRMERIEKERAAQLKREKIRLRRITAREAEGGMPMVDSKDSSKWLQLHNEAEADSQAELEELSEETRRRVLGYGMSKNEFLKMIAEQDSVSGNQLVVARLLQVKGLELRV